MPPPVLVAGPVLRLVETRAQLCVTAAKIAHLALLPLGKIEARQRVVRMVTQMNRESFGHCSNTEACQVGCPQEISVCYIARMNILGVQIDSVTGNQETNIPSRIRAIDL